MHSHLIYIYSLLLCCATAVGLQAENVLTGKVLDQATREAIDFANVSVTLSTESVPTAGATTDSDGAFRITGLKNGEYTVIVSFMGYSEQKRTVTLSGKAVNIGKIYLSEDTQALQEVEVVGQGSSMRFELDKKVFTVDQNISSAGASITDVLENIPSVDVDQEGTISLRNSEDVEIWINGKPAGLNSDNRAQVLQQMPAESIQQIEVITNPSAKYSPEGTAGIINLVMKEDRKAGYYGSVNAGIEYALAKPWTTPPGANVGFNINFSKGIVDGYFNAGYRYHTSNGTSSTDRYNIKGTGTKKVADIAPDSLVSHLLQDGNSDRRGGGLFLRGGLNLRLSSHSTLGFSGFGMVEDKQYLRMHDKDVNSYLLTDCQSGDTLREYTRTQTGGGWHPGGQATVDYTFKMQKHQLMLTASYMHFTFRQDNFYTQTEGCDTTRQEQINNSLMQTVEAKADYEWKPTQQSRLEAGYQATVSWNTSDGSAYNGHHHEQELYNYYTTFNSQEQNHALYITYGNRFWEHLSVQIGLRGEYFMRHLSSSYKDENGDIQDAYAQKPQKRDTAYFQVFPSAYISYDFGHGHELQLNYTRRVDRPRGHQINPRLDFSDSTNISYGNTDLLPAYSSSLELNYLKNWERHTLSAGLFWRYKDGEVQNVRYMDGGVMKNTYLNVAKRQELGVEVVAKNRLFKEVLQLTTNVNFYWNSISSAHYEDYLNGTFVEVDLPAQNILAWSARINAQFLFTKTFSGQVSARYRSPRVVAQGQTAHRYAIDLGLRKTFLNKQLALALNLRDILNSRSRRNTTWGDSFWQYQDKQWHSRTISLTLTYNFGNNRPKENKPAATDAQRISSSFDESSGSDE